MTATPTELLRDFTAWVRPRRPRHWATAVPRMRVLVADFLAERFPHEGRDRLDELAREHVTGTGRRVSVEMGKILDGLAN